MRHAGLDCGALASRHRVDALDAPALRVRPVEVEIVFPTVNGLTRMWPVDLQVFGEQSPGSCPVSRLDTLPQGADDLAARIRLEVLAATAGAQTLPLTRLAPPAGPAS